MSKITNRLQYAKYLYDRYYWKDKLLRKLIFKPKIVFDEFTNGKQNKYYGSCLGFNLYEESK